MLKILLLYKIISQRPVIHINNFRLIIKFTMKEKYQYKKKIVKLEREYTGNEHVRVNISTSSPVITAIPAKQ